MAIPYNRQDPNSRRTIDYTKATGATHGTLPSAIQTFQPPVIIPPILIGIDAVKLNPITTTLTYGFPAIIKRQAQANPLVPSSSTQTGVLTALDGSLLIFSAFVQGRGTQNVSLSCEAVTDTNAIIPGPFLGPGTYTNFRVVVDNPDKVKGIIIGQLHYQPPNG